jgi:lysozyme
MFINRRSMLRALVGLAGFLVATAAVPSATGQSRLSGIDVSDFQGTVNWQAVKNSGITFAFAKATEGTTFTARTFARNWSEMKRVGIIPGAYHFGHPGSDPVAQARRFAATVKNANGGKFSGALQLVLDIEVTDGRSPAQVSAWIVSFINEIKAQTGRPGIIYTGFFFWRDRAGNSANNLNCPLWLAAYVPESQLAHLIPRAWTTWTFWQYTDRGSVPGVSGNVDRDVFNGNLTTLRRLTIP